MFGLFLVFFIFIKMFKLFFKLWRSRGIFIVIFFDDGFGGGIDFVFVKINSLVVYFDFLKFGFVFNEDKF